MTGAGLGRGAGAGLGAMMAQILGQAARPSAGEAGTQAAGGPATPAGPQTIQEAFGETVRLVQNQIALPEEQRNALIQQLAGLATELSKPDADLTRIKSLRNEIATGTPWLAPELEKLFQTQPVERAMAEAARRFMES